MSDLKTLLSSDAVGGLSSDFAGITEERYGDLSAKSFPSTILSLDTSLLTLNGERMPAYLSMLRSAL